MSEAGSTDKRKPATGTTKAAAPVPERRQWRAAPISELLPAITRPAYRRRSPATAGLTEAWPRIAGDALARSSSPRKLVGGTLTIACAGPAAMEIQHRADLLVDRANRVLGPGTVARIRLVPDDGLRPDAAPAPVRRQQPAPVALPDLPEGPLRTALERLGGHLAARSPTGRTENR